MSDMVGRVARAICENDHNVLADVSPSMRAAYRANARAAIEAIRNLDETTFALALHDIDDRRGPSRESKQVFREFYGAVFSAALKGEAE